MEYIIPELIQNVVESNIISTPAIQGDKLKEECEEVIKELHKFTDIPTNENLRLIIEESLDVETVIKSMFKNLKSIVGEEVFNQTFNQAYTNYMNKLSERHWKVGGLYEVSYKPEG